MNIRSVPLFLAALLLLGLGLTMASHRPAAQAATATAPSLTPSLADALGGKVYPATLKAEQIDETFRMVDLVDAQGNPGTYATRGETVTLGGETFLVAYFFPVPAHQPQPQQPPPGGIAHLAYINMHYVVAMLNPHPVAPAGTLPDGLSPLAPQPTARP